MKRVVITGLGAITPLGYDTKETWVNLLVGKSGIDLIKTFDTSKHTVKIAGEIPDFQPETRVEPKALKRLDRCVQLSLWATIEAVEDAEIDFTQYDRGRIGVIIGSGIGRNHVGSVRALDKEHELHPVYRSEHICNKSLVV